MKVLIACEESQTVCKEFRAIGHEAYSCDILRCSGGYENWHIHDNVINVIYDSWDLIIAHPPCTYLSNSGVSWLTGPNAKPGRFKLMEEAALFFKMFLDHPCSKIAVENPIMHKYAVNIIGRRQDQIIHPWQFGHAESKATCLWLKGLPKLKETKNVKNKMLSKPKSERQRIHYLPPSKDRAKLRSKTYKGIAEAMAEQWGKL